MTAAESRLIIYSMAESVIDSSVLWQFSLFDGLEQNQIDSIAQLMGQEIHEAGADILLEGANNDKVYFIVKGRIAIRKGLKTLYELEEGSCFGEMEILDIMPAETTARALTVVEVFTLSMDALGDIYETDLRIYSFILMNLVRDLSRRIRESNRKSNDGAPIMEWG